MQPTKEELAQLDLGIDDLERRILETTSRVSFQPGALGFETRSDVATGLPIYYLLARHCIFDGRALAAGLVAPIEPERRVRMR